MWRTKTSAFFRQSVCTFSVALVITDRLGCTVSVNGVSMQPTLNPAGSEWNDRVIAEKLTTKTLGSFTRGDLYILWAPDDPHQQIVKRLIALEGDMVFDTEDHNWVKIPQGKCWVEGDNAPSSSDSRTSFGPVDLGLFEGRVTHIIWPPSRMGPLPSFHSPTKVILGDAPEDQ